MTCSGVYTALITPFDSQGKIDPEGFRFHIKRQQAAGVSGLVVFGTTGEAATLSSQEKETLLKIAREETSLPLMAGCGEMSTTQTIENIKLAAHYGYEYGLVCTPSYNRPTQEGLFRHYEAISKVSPIPILLYNNPSRTGVHLELETLKRIAALPGVCGIKDCSTDLNLVSNILFFIKKERPEFSVLCGDEGFVVAFMALGADGAVLGGANLIPDQLKTLVDACKQGDYKTAQEIHLALIPLFNALRLESNPIPLKAALQIAGLPAGDPRLPLMPLDPKYIAVMKQTWSNVTQTF